MTATGRPRRVRSGCAQTERRWALLTVEDREIANDGFGGQLRLRLEARARLGRMDAAGRDEAARLAIRRHAATCGRMLYHGAVADQVAGGPEKSRHVHLAFAFMRRRIAVSDVAHATVAVVGGYDPAAEKSLRRFAVRCFERGRRRVAAQAFFRRHPRLRFLRRYFLGRKAVLRWA